MRGRHPALRHLVLAAMLVVLGASLLAACGEEAATPAPKLETLTPSAQASAGKRHDNTAPASPNATPSASASAKSTPSASPAQPSDGTIKRNILAGLASEPGLRGFSFKVYVDDGTVIIRGRVRTKQQKQLAEQICLTERGVKKVVSAIDVSAASGY